MERDALHLRYDGPIPEADPALAGRPHAASRAHLFQRLAAETVSEAARRRARLRSILLADDPRLPQLAHALGQYRAHGVAWHQP